MQLANEKALQKDWQPGYHPKNLKHVHKIVLETCRIPAKKKA